MTPAHRNSPIQQGIDHRLPCADGRVTMHLGFYFDTKFPINFNVTSLIAVRPPVSE